MLCPAKGTNEVEGMLTSISSEPEVVVFSSVSSAVYTYMPVYAYKRHAYKKNMYIKQFCGFA